MIPLALLRVFNLSTKTHALSFIRGFISCTLDYQLNDNTLWIKNMNVTHIWILIILLDNTNVFVVATIHLIGHYYNLIVTVFEGK